MSDAARIIACPLCGEGGHIAKSCVLSVGDPALGRSITASILRTLRRFGRATAKELFDALDVHDRRLRDNYRTRLHTLVRRGRVSQEGSGHGRAVIYGYISTDVTAVE